MIYILFLEIPTFKSLTYKNININVHTILRIFFKVSLSLRDKTSKKPKIPITEKSNYDQLHRM